MAAKYFIPPVADAATSGDESISSFVRRRFGREALHTVGETLMAGIHSGEADRLSRWQVLLADGSQLDAAVAAAGKHVDRLMSSACFPK